MTPRSLLLLSACAALTLHSVVGFVAYSPAAKTSTSIARSNNLERSLFARHQEHEQSSHRAGRAAKIVEISKMEEFLKFLGEDERLCVVKFHASWCKSCQKFGVKFRKLGLDVADVYEGNDELVQTGQVRLASIEFGANTALCRALGIKRLPYVHIYKAPVGRIADFSCGPSKFPMLQEKLDAYVNMSNEELLFEKEMDKGGELGDVIVSELQQIHKEQVMAQHDGSSIQTNTTSNSAATP